MPVGKQLSDFNPNGTTLGQTSADMIGFYGVDGVSRYAISVASAASSAGTSTAPWGFVTSTQADAVSRVAFHLPLILSRLGLSTSS